MTIPSEQRQIRRQLTLFVQDNKETIEKIRREFNSVQYNLISAHVTLCRENEIDSVDKVSENIKALKSKAPLKITFNPVDRFKDGKGVWLPASADNKEFYELRRKILKNVIDSPRQHQAHLTLMHPRNSTCTDKIFDQIKEFDLPTELFFNKVSLIEQRDGGLWTIIEEFSLVDH